MSPIPKVLSLLGELDIYIKDVTNVWPAKCYKDVKEGEITCRVRDISKRRQYLSYNSQNKWVCHAEKEKEREIPGRGNVVKSKTTGA